MQYSNDVNNKNQLCPQTNYYIDLSYTTINVGSNNIINEGSKLTLSSGQGTKKDKKHSSVWKWIVKCLIHAATYLMKIFGIIPIPPLRC